MVHVGAKPHGRAQDEAPQVMRGSRWKVEQRTDHCHGVLKHGWFREITAVSDWIVRTTALLQERKNAAGFVCLQQKGMDDVEHLRRLAA